LFGPAALPKDIITKLNAEMTRIVALPDVRERLYDSGAEPGSLPVEEFSAFVRADAAPRLVEYVAAFGFDVAFIDAERQSYDFERIEEMARAARGSTPTCSRAAATAREGGRGRWATSCPPYATAVLPEKLTRNAEARKRGGGLRPLLREQRGLHAFHPALGDRHHVAALYLADLQHRQPHSHRLRGRCRNHWLCFIIRQHGC
jgi:hypothetical protein